MENENKNIPEAKKPNLTMIIIIAAAAVLVIAGIVVACILLGQGADCTHVDADADGKCDNCSELLEDKEDGEELVTVTVVDTDGNVAAGVTFTLKCEGLDDLTLTTGADGTVKADIYPDTYSVSYDYETLPANCTPDTFSVTVAADTSDISLIISNNTPNGTAQRPFIIVENVTDLTIAAGEEIFYTCRVVMDRTLRVLGEGIEINYNGESYTSEVTLLSGGAIVDTGHLTTFSVKNTSAVTVETQIEMIFPEGSLENPIEITLGATTANVPAEQGIHYKWTATQSGVLVISKEPSDYDISANKISANDIPIYSDSQDNGDEHLEVSAGETVFISVSNNTKEAREITFTLSVVTP